MGVKRFKKERDEVMEKETKRLIVDAVIALLIVAVIFVLVFVLGSFGFCINHCGDCFTPCNLTALV